MPLSVIDTNLHVKRARSVIISQCLKLRPSQGRVHTSGIAKNAIAVDIPEITKRITIGIATGGSVQCKGSSFVDGVRSTSISRRHRVETWNYRLGELGGVS